ncbi:MAG TPA: methyltransferase domain-containing protein [Firmicutes bacterium]|nr:methyltransferase domain-containing protein [Bacillota bacterium]
MAVLVKSVIYAQQLIGKVLAPGEQAVDATAGNGHDTVFLARLVGEEGRVWAFDIQEQAIKRVQQRLEKEGLSRRVILLNKGHEEMDVHVRGPVGAIMFNLGYLPGGDHAIVTRPDTTLVAVERGLSLLRPGGLMTLVVYTGHPGGAREGEAVLDYCSRLSQREFRVLVYRFLNQRNDPPFLVAIEKEV